MRTPTGRAVSSRCSVGVALRGGLRDERDQDHAASHDRPRRERRILKRAASYEPMMEPHSRRRMDLLENLHDSVDTLEGLSPDGKMPRADWGQTDAGAGVRLWVRCRENLYRLGHEIESTGPREAADG
jgi:hypothetical protein